MYYFHRSFLSCSSWIHWNEIHGRHSVREQSHTTDMCTCVWCMATFVLKEVFSRFIPSRVSKFVYTCHITNKRENIRVHLGVKTCEGFLCFLATGCYFPWLYCVEFSVASLSSLFYVTREFHRFLHRGWAENSVGCKVFTLDSGFKIFRHVNNWTHWDGLISDWRTYV